ncbi:hypothetical protein F2Z46_23915, partial [Bacteroides fragilis]
MWRETSHRTGSRGHPSHTTPLGVIVCYNPFAKVSLPDGICKRSAMCSGCAWEQKPDKREKDTRHNKKSS